jgi:hypothetical protein
MIDLDEVLIIVLSCFFFYIFTSQITNISQAPAAGLLAYMGPQPFEAGYVS